MSEVKIETMIYFSGLHCNTFSKDCECFSRSIWLGRSTTGYCNKFDSSLEVTKYDYLRCQECIVAEVKEEWDVK